MATGNFKDLFKNVRLTTFSAVLSILTVLLFNLTFFHRAAQHIEPGFNGIAIMACLAVLMLVINFFAYYLILYLGRFVGKVIIAILFILNSVCLYFINTYDVLLDDTMMGNIYNTNYTEATSYFSVDAILYILVFGVLPCILIFATKINYGSLKRFFASIGIALLAGIAVAFANMSNWPWVDRNSTELGSVILPWSYVVNTFRYNAEQREMNREEILLPDAEITDSRKDIVVLVIGESARRDHFSLYGYERDTNPLLSSTENLKAYKAVSNGTYTIAGVKAILSHEDSGKLYEILPNYLNRAGAEVIWHTSNWGQPPLHFENYRNRDDLKKEYPEINIDYDECLLAGLKEAVEATAKDKVLIVLHTSISHGPLYSSKYPKEFETFSPVSTSVEMSSVDRSELLNAYDNSIIYTDYILTKIISDLKAMPEWRSCMMFVSDHGESLGENNLYMHGVPMSIAPAEQYEIPFIVWTSDAGTQYKEKESLTQFSVFHSVLDFLSISSPVYDEKLNIFE